MLPRIGLVQQIVDKGGFALCQKDRNERLVSYWKRRRKQGTLVKGAFKTETPVCME
jgi:hypothetical protein